MKSKLLARLSVMALLAATATAQANGLYDDTQLETIDLAFADPNWWTTLDANYQAGLDQNLAADLTYQGVVYPGVGVRIKGKTSYNLLPAGSQKASFNVEVDFTNSGLAIDGYKTLNLNNAFEDPTFCREVSFFNFIRDYMPAPRCNHVVLSINGVDWGVYANVQQYNKSLLSEFYANADGARWKCVNSLSSALQYIGTNQLHYERTYELKDSGGLANPWTAFIDVCNTVSNANVTQYATIDSKFSIDAAMWEVAAENLFMDKDSYIAKGSDFYVYLDPKHGQAHLDNYDGNETYGVALVRWPGGVLYTLPPTFHFGDPARPVLQHLMQNPRIRERYFAHLRTLLEHFDWATIGPRVLAYEALIDAAVLADTHKIYTYTDFQQNFDVDVPLIVGQTPVTAPGLRNFVDSRRAYLLALPEVSEPAPTIDLLQHSPSAPSAGQAVQVTVRVRGLNAPVGEVLLYYRALGRFLSTAMFDDGVHGDGASGDDVYGASLPISGTSGMVVDYYVGAASIASAGGAMTFEPRRAEGAPLAIHFALGNADIRITEYMYSGAGPEFFELTNVSAATVDLNGWSVDDDSAMPGVFSLSPAGVVAPGQSIVVTDASATAFTTEWNSANVVVLGGNTANLGRNDAIHVFDAGGVLHDRLAYGDQTFPGSVRAQGRSASGCEFALGADDPYRWVLASAGDVQGSWTSTNGDIGSPGVFVATMPCTVGTVYCSSAPNSTGSAAATIAEGSVRLIEQNVTLSAAPVPQSVFGMFVMASTQQQIPMFAGGQGTLCVGPPIYRISASFQNSGAGNALEHALDFGHLPGGIVFAAGQTWNFQAWFRDTNPSTTNLSSGLAVTFQ
jgi:hypothetical protein